MKIKISKNQWEKIGRSAKWFNKTAQAPQKLVNDMNNLANAVKQQQPGGQQQPVNLGEGNFQSPTAIQDTAKSMVQNLQGISSQLQSLINTLDSVSKGTPLSSPDALATMMDQMASGLQNTKKFVPALIQYIKNQSNQQQQPKR
jgi:DNA repair ATPase RecN